MYSVIAVDPEVKDENTCMSSSLGQVSKPKFFSIYYSKNIIKYITYVPFNNIL